MSKLLLLSVLLAPIIIPARAARARNPREGLKKTLVMIGIFNAFYLFTIVFIYGRI